MHTKDSDCTVNPETLLCDVCGVDHSEECPDCGGRGFHKPTCPDLVRQQQQREIHAPVAQCVTEEELAAEIKLAHMQGKLDRISRYLTLSDTVPSWDVEMLLGIVNEPDPTAEQARKQKALEEARRAQTEFWDAMTELEEVFGKDIDSTRDLENVTVEELDAQEGK